MTLEVLLQGAGVVLLLAGCALATIGLYGLILKPDIFEQLHVAGLVTGPGVVLVLLASVGTGSAEIITSAVLVVAFVLVTSPLSAHVIAQTAVRRYGAAERVATAPGPARPEAAADADAGDRDAEPTPGMRVLFAYDGSGGADLASRLAASIEWPAGTTVRLVRAAPAEELPSIDGLSQRRTEPAGREDPDEAPLQAAAELIERRGVRVETVAVSGDPADVIVDETTSFGADLLITGSRRRGFVQSLLGWSAAGEIVDRAPCPVLVARLTSLRTVMLATDGSPQSAAAVELVARWPIFDLTRIYVVTVSTDPAPQAADQRSVDLTAARLMDAGRDVATNVLRGRPGAQIVEAAQRRSVDLVVIGSRGRTGLGRTLLGSVAGEVLASSSSSVLIVTPPPRRP